MTDPVGKAHLAYRVERSGELLLEGNAPVEVPVFNAVLAKKIDISTAVQADVPAIGTIALTLTSENGTVLARYAREVPIIAWANRKEV